MSGKPRPVHDDGAVLLRKFKIRTRKQEKVERNGTNNKFDPNKVRDGFLLNVTVDKDTLLAEQAAAVRVEKPAEDIQVKAWYLLSFDEVIELHSKKKPPKKKEVVPHPAFGVSSKPRFENIPSSSSRPKTKLVGNAQTKSPTKSGTPAAVDEAAAEEQLVKGRRLRVSDLQSEITAIEQQIKKVEGDSQRYTSQMQKIMSAAEKSDADLVILKQNAVRTLSNARSVVNKVIQKNRQHDSLKRTLVQDIKKWENNTRKAYNPYAESDFIKMSSIVEKDKTRRMLRYRIRVALFKFAARVMHRDPAKRSKWRELYTLGSSTAAPRSIPSKSSTRGSPPLSSKSSKLSRILQTVSSEDDIGLRKSSVLSTTAQFKPNLASGNRSSVVSSAVSTDSNSTSFTLLVSAAAAPTASTQSMPASLRPSMIKTNNTYTGSSNNSNSTAAVLKRSGSTVSTSPVSGGGAGAARTSSVTFSAGTKTPNPPPPPPPPLSVLSPTALSNGSNGNSTNGSPRSASVISTMDRPNTAPTVSTSSASGNGSNSPNSRTGSAILNKDEVRGIKRGSFSQLFGAVG